MYEATIVGVTLLLAAAQPATATEKPAAHWVVVADQWENGTHNWAVVYLTTRYGKPNYGREYISTSERKWSRWIAAEMNRRKLPSEWERGRTWQENEAITESLLSDQWKETRP